VKFCQLIASLSVIVTAFYVTELKLECLKFGFKCKITKLNLSLYSSYYAEACNELAVFNCTSAHHSAKATQLLA